MYYFEEYVCGYLCSFELDENDWWIGECAEVPGILTQGRTYQEAIKRMGEAILLYLDGIR